MGISVLLVDDERLERVLIRNGFEWGKHDFQIIGEAECAEDALEFVRYRKPDIVITDISMPRMDGLELAQKILEIHSTCHIIIVTGYREFDYARRAVKIGVEDFLLKPVSIRDIEEITDKIKKQIENENSKNLEVEELRKSALADQDIVMESFFQRLVVQRVSREEVVRKLSVYNYEKLLDCCICANIHLIDENMSGDFKSLEHLSDKQKEALKVIKEYNENNILCFIHYMQNIIVYFILEEQKTDNVETILNVCEKIRNKLKAEEVFCTIGISTENKGFEGISKAYEESERAISASVYLGREQVITYPQYELIMKQQSGKGEIDWDNFTLSIENCLDDKVRSYVEEYMHSVWGLKLKEIEMLRLMTMNFISKAGATLNKYGMSLIQLTDEEQLYNKICNINTIEEMETFLLEQLHIIMEYHNSKKLKKGNRVVEEAIGYIHDNIYEQDISLKTIAAAVYSNESYLSRMFKKETGISLIEYITQKRIEESIRLLNTTDLKVYEIAEKIGFRDSHYFSICFKKYTGATIKEFKGK